MLQQERFLELRNRVLTSASPIQSPEYLRGRESALARVVDALTAPGRHAFIYGYRGVGKTSLAQTTAFKLQSSVGAPVLVACDKQSTFNTICNSIIRQALQISPLERKGQTRLNLGATVFGTGGSFGIDRNSDKRVVSIESVSDAIEYFRSAIRELGIGLVVVVDEFDQLHSAEEHAKFASLVKQSSDNKIDLRFIFCGIADTVEALFSEHESIFRQMHSEKIDRLPLQPRIDIINSASEVLEIEIQATHKYRIAQISDGFPSFVHLLSEKVFTAAFHRDLDLADQDAYKDGIDTAISSVEVTLRKRYEDALHKNTKKYEHVIWALAADKLLEANVDTIWNYYKQICDDLEEETVSRNNFTTKLNQFCKEEYAKILDKPRRSNYTFNEKMMRAYARLRAERQGCELGRETP